MVKRSLRVVVGPRVLVSTRRGSGDGPVPGPVGEEQAARMPIPRGSCLMVTLHTSLSPGRLTPCASAAGRAAAAARPKAELNGAAAAARTPRQQQVRVRWNLAR